MACSIDPSTHVCLRMKFLLNPSPPRSFDSCACFATPPSCSGVHIFDDAPGSASSLAVIDQLISTLRAMADDASSAWRGQTRRVLLRCLDAAVGSGRSDMGRAVGSGRNDEGKQLDSDADAMVDDAATVPRDCVVGALAVLGMHSS
jgi:hypothetical protein